MAAAGSGGQMMCVNQQRQKELQKEFEEMRDNTVLLIRSESFGHNGREPFCLLCKQRAQPDNGHVTSSRHRNAVRNWWTPAKSNQSVQDSVKWVLKDEQGPNSKEPDVAKAFARVVKADTMGEWQQAVRNVESNSSSTDASWGDGLVESPGSTNTVLIWALQEIETLKHEVATLKARLDLLESKGIGKDNLGKGKDKSKDDGNYIGNDKGDKGAKGGRWTKSKAAQSQMASQWPALSPGVVPPGPPSSAISLSESDGAPSPPLHPHQ